MHILTSSNPQPVYTHTPDYELRARYRRWAAAERKRREKDDFNALVNRRPTMLTDSAERDAIAYDARHQPTEPGSVHTWMSGATNEFEETE